MKYDTPDIKYVFFQVNIVQLPVGEINVTLLLYDKIGFKSFRTTSLRGKNYKI